MASVGYWALKKKIHDVLKNDTLLSGVQVEYGVRGLPVVQFPAVKIYSKSKSEEMRRVGGKAWDVTMDFVIECWACDWESIERSDEKLADLVDKVEQVLRKNEGLGGMVLESGITEATFEEGKEEDVFISVASLTFSVKLRA